MASPEPGRSSPSSTGHQPGDLVPSVVRTGTRAQLLFAALAFHYNLLTSSPLTSHLPQEKFSQGSYAKIIIKGENG